MNAHRSMKRADIASRSPRDIALMIASEFSRASSRRHHRENVLSCYSRAHELLGIMETLPLTEESGLLLQPLYRSCATQTLTAESALIPERVLEVGQRLADAFLAAAERLSRSVPHA
jgi:hypothetical protein